MKVCLDSRLIQPGEYFVPVIGENFDGHSYIEKALANGAAGILEEKDLYKETAKKLNRIKPKIIGITGSSGKSTTTKLLHTVLRTQLNTCLGDLNTKLGLSVNVINDMENNCEVFVAEMGMDKVGELKDTTSLFPLDFAVITTINHVHVEKLGSMKNLIKAKGEILTGLKKSGVALINKENEHTKHLGTRHKGKVIWFDSTPLLNYPELFQSDFNIRNANVCTILARNLGFKDAQILKALQTFRLPKGRLNILEGINEAQLIDDTYNANPESVRYALDFLHRQQGKRKIAILGDMRELGKYSKKDHAEIANYINELKVDIFIGVGKLAQLIAQNVNAAKTKVFWIENADQFNNLLQNKTIRLKKDDVVLIKGSQGQRMEKIVKLLLKDPGKAKDLLVRQDARWG
jgi:UDP-N-acetylmuramoyl-tripeptide--D-alanyl-D-alanine ligase